MHYLREINCVICKTNITVKAKACENKVEYKLVHCPTCNTPLREIPSNVNYSIEKVCLADCK